MKPGRLTDLARLAAARGEAALAALHRAALERDEQAAEIAALRREVAVALHVDDLAHDAAAAIRAQKFAAWAERKQAELNLTLARLNVRWAECRDAAARAHGQEEVLKTLAERDAAQRRLLAQRRHVPISASG